MSNPQSRENENEPALDSRSEAIALVIKGSFVIIEAVYGFSGHSLAVLADAAHNLSDILGLLLGWGANFLVSRPPTPRYTYGLGSSTILAGLLNAFILLLVKGGIAWEAVRSLFNLAPIPGKLVIAMAIASVLVNMITALLFLSESDRDWNFRSAFSLVTTNVMVALGVLLSGLALMTTQWYWFDPIVSLIILAFSIFKTWQLLQESLNLALDGVPQQIEPLAVRTYLTELPGVREVQELHIWGISTTQTALTVHLVMPEGFPGDAFLEHLFEELHEKFGIDRITIQVESCDRPIDITSDKLV